MNVAIVFYLLNSLYYAGNLIYLKYKKPVEEWTAEDNHVKVSFTNINVSFFSLLVIYLLRNRYKKVLNYGGSLILAYLIISRIIIWPSYHNTEDDQFLVYSAEVQDRKTGFLPNFYILSLIAPITF